MPVLVVMTGIPSSGKSSFVERNFSHFIKICKDEYVENYAITRYGYDLQEAYEFLSEEDFHRIYDDMQKDFSQAVKRKEDIVIDAENVLKTVRSRYKVRRSGYYNVSVFMDTPLSICLKRNLVRPKSINQNSLLSMYSFLEIPTREFFDKNITVNQHKKSK